MTPPPVPPSGPPDLRQGSATGRTGPGGPTGQGAGTGRGGAPLPDGAAGTGRKPGGGAAQGGAQGGADAPPGSTEIVDLGGAVCSGDLVRFRVTFDTASVGRYWDAVRHGLLRRDELVGAQFLLWPPLPRDPASPFLPRRSECLVGVAFGFPSVGRGAPQEPVADATPPEGFEERVAHYDPALLTGCGRARDAFGHATVDLRLWHRAGTTPFWGPESQFTPVEAVVTLHVRPGPSGITSYLRLPADLGFGFTYVGLDGAASWPLAPFDDEQLLRQSVPIQSGRLRLDPGPADVDKVYY